MYRKNKYRSLYYSLTAVLFWSTIASAFKITLNELTNGQILFYASLTSTVVLGVIAKLNGKSFSKIIFGKGSTRNLLMGLFNPFVYYLILIKAYDILPAQEAMVINYSWPIVLSIFSVIFLNHKFTIKSLSGLFISFIGVVIIATKGQVFSLKFENAFGDFLAILSTIIWASFWIFNLKDKRANEEKLFGAFFFGTIYTAIYILFYDSFVVSESLYFLGVIYIGLFEMGITFFLWLKGLELSDNKVRTSTLVFLSPFLSLIFIGIIVGEEILISSILGLVFIIGGILIQQFDKQKATA